MSTPRQYCTFRLDGRTFGVDVGGVQEVLRPQRLTRVPLATPVVEGLINLRGQIVTALDLRRRLALPPRPDGVAPMNLVLRTATGIVALLVDEIGDVVEVDDSTFEAPPLTLDGVGRDLIVGTHKLDDQLLLVLDADRVVELPAAS